jgi:hypothetical protein
MLASTGLLASITTRDNSMMGTPHTHIATTSTHLWESFSFIFKQVHYNFVYLQFLLQANPTRLLTVQLFGDLLSNWRHLL